MNKIQKMKMVGFNIASPSYRKNSQKKGVEKSACVEYSRHSDFKSELSTRG